ncbi:hypothetical protein HPT27_08140 [Permianibacter sp. IMCC34836]|uniref:hypothetical protein n=1 Tax=Permianibacter fluminis TaxID=2738515 RepID=UPI001551CA56|nr:hypothetical protein [Permianibacter fluminis]NQD36992.1 hypothetical protein [Permianibacter fluminis]
MDDGGLPASVLEKLNQQTSAVVSVEMKARPAATEVDQSPAEPADVTQWRQSQQAIRQQKQALQEQRRQQPGYSPIRSLSAAPEFASQCVKLVWQEDGNPSFQNQCGKPVQIAYCWVDWPGEHGALDCQHSGIGLNTGGAATGPNFRDGKYQVLWFACTKPGLPTAIELSLSPASMAGQCFW